MCCRSSFPLDVERRWRFIRECVWYGELAEFWSDSDFEVALFSIIVFLQVMQRTRTLIKKDKEEFFFLQRLRFWAVSLAKAHMDTNQLRVNDLLESDVAFKKWCD